MNGTQQQRRRGSRWLMIRTLSEPAPRRPALRRLVDGLALPHPVRHRRGARGQCWGAALRAACPLEHPRRAQDPVEPATSAATFGDRPTQRRRRRHRSFSGGAASATTASKVAAGRAARGLSYEVGPGRDRWRSCGSAPMHCSPKLDAEGWNSAQLYGRDTDDGVGGRGASSSSTIQGLRSAARSGRDDARPAGDLGARRCRGRRPAAGMAADHVCRGRR